MYKISVALATYNGEKYIIEQLDSLRSQTRQPDEVIISDDFSTDNTCNIIEEYIKKYSLNTFKIVKNEFGKGVYGNFYTAIKKTTGDIVLLCDQDDVWKNNKITVIEEEFKKNQSILCLNTSFDYIDKNGCPIYDKYKNKTNHGLIKTIIGKNKCKNVSFSQIINKNISPGMTMAVSRKLVDIYLDISVKAAIHDWELNCIASSLGGGVFYECLSYKIQDS